MFQQDDDGTFPSVSSSFFPPSHLIRFDAYIRAPVSWWVRSDWWVDEVDERNVVDDCEDDGREDGKCEDGVAYARVKPTQYVYWQVWPMIFIQIGDKDDLDGLRDDVLRCRLVEDCSWLLFQSIGCQGFKDWKLYDGASQMPMPVECRINGQLLHELCQWIAE